MAKRHKWRQLMAFIKHPVWVNAKFSCYCGIGRERTERFETYPNAVECEPLAYHRREIPERLLGATVKNSASNHEIKRAFW